MLVVHIFWPDLSDDGAPYPWIGVPVVVLYPFLFDILSFVDVRLTVALGYMLATLGVTIAFRFPARLVGYLIGWLCLLCALMLYQSTFNAALVMVVLYGFAELLRTNSLRRAFASRLLPGGLAAALALVAYLVIRHSFSDVSARFDAYYRFPSDMSEMWRVFTSYLRATYELLFVEQSIFPFVAKLGLCLGRARTGGRLGASCVGRAPDGH